MKNDNSSNNKRPHRGGGKTGPKTGPRTGANTGARFGPKAGPGKDSARYGGPNKGRPNRDRLGDDRPGKDRPGKGGPDRGRSDRSRPDNEAFRRSGAFNRSAPPKEGAKDDRKDSFRDRSEREVKKPFRKSTSPETDLRDAGPAVYPDEPKGIAIRRAAADILTLVRDGTSLDDALRECRTYQALAYTEDGEKDPAMTRADKGFARAIATTVLRRRGTLDHLIGAYLDKPLPPRAIRIMDILRISAAQSLMLETPAHAAVSLATAHAKERQETKGYANLVNAIARKLSTVAKDKLEALPGRTDTPSWLWRSWERAYGPAIARKIATAHQQAAPLDISFKNASAKQRFQQAYNNDANDLVTCDYNKNHPSLRLSPAPTSVTALPGFQDGGWWVQDVSASLPVFLLGDIKDKSVIDLCAAPGGKTLQLAAGGASVTAVDKSEERLQRLHSNLVRTNLKADVITMDALDYKPEASVDIVLLDAPCSATGTIRRHPDIPWSKSEDDVSGLAQLQARLIDHALAMLKPGGILLYCTCSLQPEEGEKQIASALTRHDRLERIAFTNDLPEAYATAVTRDGDLRLLPSMGTEYGGMDGFFISRLQLKG